MAKKKIEDFEYKRASQLTEEERKKLIEEYTVLIRFIAKRISIRLPANIDVEDLVSSGVIGLIDAIEKYDPTSCLL